jgi:hypothetical protein
MKNFKGIILALILVVILILVGLYGFEGGTKYTTYSGPVMSFEYPSGWNIAVMDYNKTVEVKKDDNNQYEVFYLGDSPEYANKLIYDNYWNYYGNYTESGTTYYTFSNSNNSTLYYIFAKNGNSYEVKGLTDLMNPDPMKQVIATIK